MLKTNGQFSRQSARHTGPGKGVWTTVPARDKENKDGQTVWQTVFCSYDSVTTRRFPGMFTNFSLKRLFWLRSVKFGNEWEVPQTVWQTVCQTHGTRKRGQDNGSGPGQREQRRTDSLADSRLLLRFSDNTTVSRHVHLFQFKTSLSAEE